MSNEKTFDKNLLTFSKGDDVMIKETTKYKDFTANDCDDCILNEITHMVEELEKLANFVHHVAREYKYPMRKSISSLKDRIDRIAELELAIMEKHDILKSKVENQ